MIINTIQDCEQAILVFNLEGKVYFNTNNYILFFNIIKPKFKWFQFIKKRNFAQRYMCFQDFVVRNTTMCIPKEFNLIEENKIEKR